LHDIGKTMIRPSILKKSREELTAEEERVYREHPIHGESILRMVPNNDDAALYVRHHHERFDGLGYPDGFSGEAIPLGARIIAVADAFDKHMNHSVTATAISAVALRKVEGGAGAAFDPSVVSTVRRGVREIASRMQARGDGEGAGAAFGPSVVSTLRLVVREIGSKINAREEVQIDFLELEAGMVLSRDLKSPDGRLLALADQKVDPVQLAALRHIHSKQPITQAVYVYQEYGDGAVRMAELQA